ncbi:tetratricopeptide repeat protein [Vibrio tetraodonis]|uniref:tetratricopeptide repeat protein n=1 Tax=Vibrio tetraodonis TaxID=2231647 RepID=UPI000E0CBC7D|nr:tetratricopeptide repeat protein [Vibrio tetraodonis]
MKGTRLFYISLITMLLIGCAGNQSNIDSSLYDGKPIDTLSSEQPPKTEQEAISRGDAALSIGNSDLALYEYIRALSFENGEYKDRALYNIGRIHQSRGNLALAEKAFLLGIKQNPDNIKVLEQLGTIYSKMGDLELGKSYFYRAINADQVRLTTRNSLSGKEVIEPEQIAVLKVDQYSPEYAYMGLGVIADVDSEHKLAQAYYKQALSIKPDSVKTLINVSYSFYMSGEYRKAQRFVLQALKQEPDNEKALNNLALIYLGKGEITRAVNVFSRHMEKPEALNNVGYFLILQGKPDKAIPYLQQAIDSKSSYYKVANENLERALALVREQSSAGISSKN